jgi:hypothetical protein
MRWIALLVGCAAFLLGKPAFAIIVAADQASNSAYSAEAGGAWKGVQPTTGENPAGSDNGGTGFIPWNFAGGYHDPTVSPYANLNHFIDGVDFAHSTFNNLGTTAFGLTNANIANFGFTTRATRVFSNPLSVGSSISLQFDNPILAPLKSNDTTGYIIRLNSGGGPKTPANPNVTEQLGLFAQDGFNQGNWTRSDLTGNVNTGLGSSATTSGAVLRLTLQSAESYLLQVLPLGGGNPLYSATGNFANTGSGLIDTLEILMFGNGSGNGLTGAAGLATGQREFFFDNLSIDDPNASIAGDYNRDAKVDAADYALWRKTLNQTVAQGSGADGDHDGVITQLDYSIWRQNYASSPASGASRELNPIPVPEVGSGGIAALACIACFLQCVVRRYQRSHSLRLVIINR